MQYVVNRLIDAQGANPLIENHPLNHALKWSRSRRSHQRKRIDFVYIVQSGEFVKIGIANDVLSRVSELQVGNPVQLKLLASWKSSTFATREERELHARLKQWRVRGEWFKLPPDVLESLLVR